jgi:uncharacterized membrane protein
VRDRFVWIGTAIYAVLFTSLGAIKYGAHRNLVDFGLFSQTVASAFGCFCNPIEGSHWAFHFSPILYLPALGLLLFHSPMLLVALQAIAGALCAAPVYAMVLRRTDRRIARFAAVVVWLYPPLAGLTFGDFHENGFAPAAVLWTAYAFDAGYLTLAAICAAIVLMVKEDQAIFLGIAAAGSAFVYRSDAKRCRLSIAVAVVCALVLIVFFLLIQPHAAAVHVWEPDRFYAWTWSNAARLFGVDGLARLWFAIAILAPLAFVPLRSRLTWLAAAPLAEVLLSRMNTTFTLGTHYTGAWAGYLLIGFAAALSGLREPAARRALWWAAALAAVELVAADPLHPGINLRARQARDVALDATLARLPRYAGVATQEEAYTHLALDDPRARLLPERGDIETDACFVLIDRNFPDSARLQEYGDTVVSLVRAGTYVPISKKSGIELYRRVSACR